MAKAITLGLVLGATLAPGFNSVFKTAREQAQGLKTTLANARLGATAAADVARLGARLDRLRAAQAGLGTENVKLTSRIAQTQRELNKASATAGRYGVSLDNAASRQRQFAATADQAARSLARLRAAEQRQTVRNEAKGQILGTVGAVAAVGAPVKESLEFEHRLRGIGNIADLTGQQVASLGDSVQRVGVKTNQTSSAMLDAFNVLLGKGMDPARATAVLEPIGKTATAAQASVEDLSTTTFALVDNLKLAESQIPKAMDMLSQAGKEGSFELKDMARYFPQLTAKVGTLGLKGTEAVATLGAALQVAMKGAGTPEEAARNLENFLQKVTSPETKKNFTKMGINFEAGLKQAIAKGQNPLEYVVGLIQKITKGDQFKIGALFGDMQVQNFLAPMMQHMEEYREIKGKALGASGVVDRDFANMMATGTERIKHARVELGRLAVTLGEVLLPAVGASADKLGAVLSVTADLVKKYPTLTTVVTYAAVGLVGYKVAALGARFGGTLLLDGVDFLTKAFNSFRPSVIRTNAALVASRTATLGLNMALLANPWTWVALAGVGAAFAIYKWWGPISSFFEGVGEGIKEGLAPAIKVFDKFDSVLSPIWNKLKGIRESLGTFFGSSDHADSPDSKSWGKRIGKVLPEAALRATIGNAPTQLLLWALSDDAAASKPSSGLSSAHGQSSGSSSSTTPPWATGNPALGNTIPKGIGPQSSPIPRSDPAQAYKGEMAGLMAAMHQEAAGQIPPASNKSANQAPITMNNTVNVTFTGMESVQTAIKLALDEFSRNLEGRLSALRAQQGRLSFGG